MVSNNMNSDSGTFKTSCIGLAVLGSKYRTQSYPTYPIAPPVKGGNVKPGTFSTLNSETSFSKAGRGSISSPCPGPVFRTFRGPAPMKLYLPSVSAAALSKRNDCFPLNFPVIFRYAAEGVIRSEDICAKRGTVFAEELPPRFSSRLRTVSSGGEIVSW